MSTTPTTSTTSATPTTPTTPTTSADADQRVEPAHDGAVADQLRAMLDVVLGTPRPVRVEFWDGSATGPTDGPGTLYVRSPDALRHILWAPGELGLARAFVTGVLDADGDVIELLTALSVRSPREQPIVRSAPAALAAAKRFDVLARPLPPPAIEYQPPRLARAHTKARDAATVGHHYDVSNTFYEMVLGPSMTYSCALFADPDADLATAQAAKHDRVCRKLGLDLARGSRLLDVGCGWGSMAIHAAQQYGAEVLGITISAEQAQLARERVRAAGVADRVEIRLQDYRDLHGETFDVISSIGMSEHVGHERLDTYFSTLRGLLGPQGRLLNHAISSVGGSKLPKRSFVYRYIFPDGELIDVGETLLAMERAGFEIRDVESLREHYATTLRHWVANLEHNWESAVAEVGEQRARAWRLYMAASSVGFTDGGVNIHQVLGVLPDAAGTSGMPVVRPF